MKFRASWPNDIKASLLLPVGALTSGGSVLLPRGRCSNIRGYDPTRQQDVPPPP